jgi:hypothetical protein
MRVRRGPTDDRSRISTMPRSRRISKPGARLSPAPRRPEEDPERAQASHKSHQVYRINADPWALWGYKSE